MASLSLLHPRQHIQNHSAGGQTEPHWGYADRVVPCVVDAGSCAYLDLVYGAHDIGMLYTGIMWALIGGILFIWALGRRLLPSRQPTAALLRAGESQVPTASAGGLARLRAAIASSSRRFLLPESVRLLFGHTTRLQVAILAILAAYLIVFSFVGMEYTTWVTPVKGMDGVYNTRTTLGPWADRVGVLAYALTPLSVMLASRESILSVLTGVPYQSFIFMHRWLGYIIFVQSALHTIGWCVVEIKLYQPQPKVAAAWIVQTYMIWGVVAMILLLLLWGLSTKWAIRAFGYEFFRKAHYVLAMVYIGACYAHWEKLGCFLIPGIVIWGIDRIARLVRTGLLHYNYLPSGSIGFSAAKAKAQFFADPENGDVVRLDFHHPQQPWAVGQHFFLCFPELNIWQSHPMTPLAPPTPVSGPKTGSLHSYVLRAKQGETRKLADLVTKRLAAGGPVAAAAKTGEKGNDDQPSVSVILTGAYGQDITRNLTPATNILCVAGGTGVTFVLPVLLDLVRSPAVSGRKIELVWAVRHQQDMEWIRPELDELRAASASHGVGIDVYVTRESKTHHRHNNATNTTAEAKEAGVAAITTTPDSASTSSGEEVEETDHVAVHRPARVETPRARRPHMKTLVDAFVADVASGPTTVFASGPLEMVADLRTAVAAANSGGRVWKGEERFDVRLVSDDRVEW